jgi:hypothetical protein
MMYQVQYLKPKKKGYSTQTATFLKIDDAETEEQALVIMASMSEEWRQSILKSKND